MDYELFKLHHRGMDCLGVRLSREDSRNNLIRKIKGVKWSNTHKCWYVTGESMADLRRIFNQDGSDGVIDAEETKALLPVEIKSIETEKPEPRAFFVPNTDQLLDLKIFKRYMEVKRLRKNTIINYEKAILKFLGYFRDRNWRELKSDEIQNFQYDEIIDKGLSFAYQSI